jgi:chemotaxis signal transduction protein
MLMNASDALARNFDLVAPADSKPPPPRRFRGVRIGTLGLLVALDCGGEILEEARLYALPGAASWCRGLINLRGSLIPAFDLHEALGIAHLRADRQWWLVLGAREDALAFPVDALPAVLSADSTSTVQPSLVPEPLRGYAGAAFRIASELWFEFHHRDFVRALGATRRDPLIS